MGYVRLDGIKYNISDILRAKGLDNYTAAQGYTIGKDNLNVTISLMKSDTSTTDATRESVMLGLSGNNQYITSGLKLIHANDCTYYDGKYYIAPAGDGSNKVVPAYKWDGSKWVKDDSYTYIPLTNKDIPVKALSKVSNIAHISGKNFILGQDIRISVCKLDTTKKQFQEFSRFELDLSDKSKLVRDNCERLSQGIYYKDKKLYKVFAYRKNDVTQQIAMNDVAVFDMKGTTPSFNGTTLNASYTCDNSNLATFELEGIAASSEGKLYVSANVQNGKDQQDAIYSITLE